MSKKRKTRKEKESAQKRQELAHVHADAPIYSVAHIATAKPVRQEIAPKQVTDQSALQKDEAYLRHDLVAITAASGIIIGFDVLLFVLFTTGFLKLNFLGY